MSKVNRTMESRSVQKRMDRMFSGMDWNIICATVSAEEMLSWSIHHVDERRINRTSRTGTL